MAVVWNSSLTFTAADLHMRSFAPADYRTAMLAETFKHFMARHSSSITG